ncbi:type VII secretion-associated serine protease mycosin [Actinoallomurus spadix]|uniref:type VII secretion-associated serine protease mycosin n=1 Tax=Actinoallomurus spadix TaxID=79912 RepID=UPI0020933B20|nr:type VII secretion-associated serine protease mycosin [Actinoallomurus spadix]MCO5985198.1 type VII secretion-associated serine protease mycosin [Actinoallomurus spadix]
MSEPRRAFPRLVSALLAGAAVAVLSVPAAQSAVPNRPLRPPARAATADLYRGQQWTLGALHLSRAWRYSRGDGVTVAVLDTGVDGHQPDLTGRVVDGPDFTGHARRPGNRYWGRHGTEMASLIAGHGHGASGNAGIMGVAPEAKVLSIRVTWELGDPMRNDHAQVARSRDAIARGIRYATDHGAQVINMSLGGGKLFYNGNPLEESAIKYALDKGVVLVASSGNDGATGNRRNYPAAYPGVIAVGAVDRAFRPAKFTNRHTYVSVAAPGVEIVSADVAGHGYVLGTGTSSSAALVAGVSALVKARYPRLSAAEVKQALEQGTTHRPPDGRSTAVGTGVADALGALRAAARINKAEHGGASVKQPQSSSTAPDATGSRPGGGPDLMLVAVLSGGGTLLVLSLILGWRQRRRRLALADADDEDLAAPVAASPAAGDDPRRPRPPRRTPRQSGPPGPSPWEPRPSGTPSPFEPRPSGTPSPFEPRPSGTPSPFEPRPSGTPSSFEPGPPGAASFGEPRSRRPSSSWAPRTAETPSSWDPRSREPSSSEEPLPPGLAPEPPFSGTGAPATGTPAAPPRTEPFSATGVPPGAAGGPPSGPSSFTPPAEPGPPAQPAPTRPSPAQPPPAQPYGASDEPSPAAPVHPPSGPERQPLWTPPGERGDEVAPGGRSPEVPDALSADPLGDAPIDSSADVGTPLADESWESIRRGFDRLKEDTRTSGSSLFGGWSTSLGLSEDSADPPPAEPGGGSPT